MALTSSRWMIASCFFLLLCGCHSNQLSFDRIAELRRQSLACLKLAASSHADSQMRAQAIQALEYAAARESLPWIRQGLYDPHPDVRFVSSIVLSRLGDRSSMPAVKRLLRDDSPLVRAGAMFFLAKAEVAQYQDEWPTLLLQVSEVEPSAEYCVQEMLFDLSKKVTTEQLQSRVIALIDRQHAGPPTMIRAVQAVMVRRGEPATTRKMIALASRSQARDQARAIEMLAYSPDSSVIYVLLDRLAHSPYIEGQLAAASSLSLFGRQDGLKLVLRHVSYGATSQESGEIERAMNIRVRACRACQDLGDPSALVQLSELWSIEQNLRVRLACAAALLKLIAIHTEVDSRI